MTMRSYSVDSGIAATCFPGSLRQLNINHVAARARRPRRAPPPARRRRARDRAHDEVGRAQDQGASHGRPESRDRESIHEAPDKQEQDGIDNDYTRSEEHTSELQSPCNLVCRLLLEKKNTGIIVDPVSTTINLHDLVAVQVHPTVIESSKIHGMEGCEKMVLFNMAVFFFFNDTATTEIYTLSLHDALPI